MRNIFVVVFIIHVAGPLSAQVQELDSGNRIRIILAPVVSLTDNESFQYLKGTIFNVFRVNLKMQDRIAIINEEVGADKIISTYTDFESYFAILARAFPHAVALLTEYYVEGKKIYILVNVWDVDTLRIKNSFMETLPADLDMLADIEKMISRIVASVIRELPPTPQDTLVRKQVVTSRRKKIMADERMIEEIFYLRHAVAATLFSGLGVGRSVVSYNPGGPLVSLILSVEYTYFFQESTHLRFRADYLGLSNLFAVQGVQRELSVEVLAGVHTLSAFSFSIEIGLALSYDLNDSCMALAYTEGTSVRTRNIERLSLTIPVVVGCTQYFSPHFFINCSLTYNGMTYTFEPLPPSAYNVGYSSGVYFYGLSLWNLLSFSVLLKAGVKF